MTLAEISPATESTRFEQHALFQRCYPDLRRYFLRRGFSTDRADDLVQETFVEVIRSWSNFEGESSVEGWVFGIARNVYLGTLRSSRRAKRSGQELPLEVLVDGDLSIGRPGQSEGPLARSLAAEREDLLRQAMLELPQTQQHCLALRIYQDLSYREIGSLLRISVEAAKSRVFQAKRRLQDRLQIHFEMDLE